MTYATAARIALAGIAGAELAAAADRFAERTRAYGAAQAMATATGRTLVVIGNPDTGLHTRLASAYGCGDVCVDLVGCGGCPSSITADLTRGPIAGVPDDSAVVFVSCVLEYVHDPAAAGREILRMAGDPSRVVNVAVQPWTLTSQLYPGAVSMLSPVGAGWRIEPVSLVRQVATLAVLGGLAWAALGYADGDE